MATFNKVLTELRRARDRAQREVTRLEEAIAAIGRLVGRGGAASAGKGRGRRRLSAAARRRIAAAQRARWAKVKAAKKAA